MMDAREPRETSFPWEKPDEKVTIDHATIRRWSESRGGRPAAAKPSQPRSGTETLRIAFPDQPLPEPLREISWAEFFDTFERSRLAFVYQDAVEDAIESRFYKLVSRRELDEQRG
jgi:hypothetical protein